MCQKRSLKDEIIIFASDHEKVTENGVTKQLYYIAVAISVKQDGQANKIYYAHK
jgi:hypothetical protein